MLRFTIRDVLWLMVVVAVGAGWYMEHRHKMSEREQWRKFTKELADDVAEMNQELFLLRGVKPLNNQPTR